VENRCLCHPAKNKFHENKFSVYEISLISNVLRKISFIQYSIFIYLFIYFFCQVYRSLQSPCFISRKEKEMENILSQRDNFGRYYQKITRRYRLSYIYLIISL
jgi:hypothetical protein